MALVKARPRMQAGHRINFRSRYTIDNCTQEDSALYYILFYSTLDHISNLYTFSNIIVADEGWQSHLQGTIQLGHLQICLCKAPATYSMSASCGTMQVLYEDAHDTFAGGRVHIACFACCALLQPT